MSRKFSAEFIWALAFITALLDIYFLFSSDGVFSSLAFAVWSSLPFVFLAVAEARIGRNIFLKLVGFTGFIWENSYFWDTHSWKPNSGNSTASLGLIFGPIYLFVLFGIICLITFLVKRRR
jgi:hypothetical protein